MLGACRSDIGSCSLVRTSQDEDDIELYWRSLSSKYATMTTLLVASSPIASKAKKCLELFADLVAQSQQPEQDGQGVSAAEAVDVLGRFKIWAGNIGALQPFESRSSLDYRLRDVPRISTQVVDLLDELAESIEDGKSSLLAHSICLIVYERDQLLILEAFSILSNERENRTSLPIEADGHVFDSHATHGGDHTPMPGDEEEISEIREIFESIIDAINSLFRLSTIIRNNTGRDRWAKAATAALTLPFNSQFDVDHVHHKFPALNSKGKKWLVARLGKAITQRRQYLRYCREHHDKTSREYEPAPKPEVFPSAPPRQEAIVNLAADAQSAFSKPTSTLAPTQASTLLLTNDPLPLEEFREDTKSQTSYATSNNEDSSSSTLDVIKLEEVSRGLSHFECPYCWQIQTSKTQKAWK